MRRIWSWLRRLSWKWRVLLLAVVIVILVPGIILGSCYLSRMRAPPDYSDILGMANMTYVVSYDSGDGDVEEERTWTLKVAETDVLIGNDTCFRTVTVMRLTKTDPLPVRKAHAILVGSTKVTLGAVEIWRSQEDLRVVREWAMQVNLPIVNTAITISTYSGYDGYPGWPYSLGDSWTYEVHFATDTPLQPDWTDTYRAEVVADDAVVVAADVEYECFKVVNTMVATTNKKPGGGGVDSTRVEYWANTGKSIAPLKSENTSSYMGTESRIMVDMDLPEEGSGWLTE